MSDPITSPDGKWMWTGAEWIPAPPNSENSMINEIPEFEFDTNEMEVDGKLVLRASLSNIQDSNKNPLTIEDIKKYLLSGYLLDANEHKLFKYFKKFESSEINANVIKWSKPVSLNRPGMTFIFNIIKNIDQELSDSCNLIIDCWHDRINQHSPPRRFNILNLHATRPDKLNFQEAILSKIIYHFDSLANSHRSDITWIVCKKRPGHVIEFITREENKPKKFIIKGYMKTDSRQLKTNPPAQSIRTSHTSNQSNGESFFSKMKKIADDNIHGQYQYKCSTCAYLETYSRSQVGPKCPKCGSSMW